VPELPEVETMRRGIAVLTGRRIVDVRRTVCRRKPIAITPRIDHFRRRSVGQVIDQIGRVGKRIVLQLGNNDRIVIEPRMTGLVLLAVPPTQQHLRFCITLAGRQPRELLFWDRRGLGTVRLFSPEEFTAALGPDRLGPDALQISAEVLRERLASSRRAIKVALLDQRAVAGVGNLYASELLHLAGVHPATRCDRLRVKDWPAIHGAMVKILRAAIRHEGSTLSDGTYRNALNQDGGYQNYHRVYDREGESCTTCDDALVTRIVQSQRSTFLCRKCQRRR
jgi:formamidopyrimidine-DNA glycosylase